LYKTQDESKLLTGLINGKIKIWEVKIDIKKMDFQLEFSKEFIAHSDAVTCINIVEKLNIIITGGEDGCVYIRNYYDLKIITVINPELKITSHDLNLKILDINVSEFDLIYIKCYYQDEIFLYGYNLNGLKFGCLKSAVNQLYFTPTGKLIISEYFSKEISIYHPVTFKLVIRFIFLIKLFFSINRKESFII